MHKNKLLSSFIFLIITVLSINAQNCDFFIKGTVIDTHSGTPLSDVQVYISENNKLAVTDNNGLFSINKLCPGEYHLVFNHISCETLTQYINLEKNNYIEIKLEHQHDELNEVFINAESKNKSIQSTVTITEQTIQDNATKNLSAILENITGVSSLKNGNSVGKPIVHGLFGNRVTILNNGVPHSGQQWGNDHAPEIDPLVANKIKVIKGVSSLQYDGTHLGSVILIEPEKIDKEPHLHGKGNYFFESNGLSNGLNFQTQQYKKLGWKLNATYKKAGDLRAPNYFLTATGKEEINGALQFEKKIFNKINTELYLSTYNGELGILAGSRVGTPGDVLMANSRSIPSATKNSFSYEISAPNQEVNHHLGKLKSKFKINNSHSFETTLSYQQNLRKEFDPRRGGRTTIPVLSTNKKTYFLEGKYNASLSNSTNLITGFHFTDIKNVNDPDTGIIPLIPDYNSIKTNGFIALKHRWNQWVLEYGGRYNQSNQKTVNRTRGVNSRFIRFENNFKNYALSTGVKHQIKENLSFTLNTGIATRNPEVNELYSEGLHQAVAAFEKGDPNLNIEKSWKTTLGSTGVFNQKFSYDILLYYQKIDNYIFLKPDRLILTNRGWFSQFIYNQTDALISGIDLSTTYWFTNAFSANLKLGLIKADNISDNEPLINVPTNVFATKIKYEFPNTLKIRKTKFENTTISIENKLFSKSRTTAEQDVEVIDPFTRESSFPFNPPNAYNLVNFEASTNIPLKKTRLRLVAKIENLLNTRYRNYLNRLRYFADETGINFSFGTTLNF